MKHLLLSASIGFWFSFSFASVKPDQDSTKSISVYDSDPADTSDVDSTDALVNMWYINKANTVCDSTLLTIENADLPMSSIPDSVFIQRLARIPSAVPLTYNRIVRNFIEMYLFTKRDKLESIVGLSNYYFPIFDDIFDEYEVPNELKYMSVIESALNPRACSRTRAIGLWQFMYGTGRLYGLTINSLVDDRRDPIKATYAAVKFSKDLYAMFNDWQLVIAAYNCGPGNVKKAIRRAGGKRNFWEIYYYLPRETRGHVPAFIAAVYVVNYYREHNVIPKAITYPLTSDTIMVTKKLNLGQISEVLKIPLETLRDMNPQYLCDIVPAYSTSPCAIRLPNEYTTRFIDLQDSIGRYKEAFYFNPSIDILSPSKGTYASASGNGKRLVYVVRQGDNLGSISSKFHVSINQIKDWNGFNKNTIRVGQRLVLFVPSKRYAAAAAVVNVSTNTQEIPAATTAGSFNNEKSTFYVVREGDTIWEIARKHPGVTAEQIMQRNKLGSNDKIVPGQRLVISE